MFFFYLTLPTTPKTVFDRLFAVAECDKNYRNPVKKSVLLMAAEGYGFDDALNYYQNLLKHLGWSEIGHVLAGGVMKVGDIKNNPKLKEAYELGKKISADSL